MTIKEFKGICYEVGYSNFVSVTNNIDYELSEEEWGCTLWAGEPEEKGDKTIMRKQLSKCRQQLKNIFGIKCEKTECDEGIFMNVEWSRNMNSNVKKSAYELFTKEGEETSELTKIIDRWWEFDNYYDNDSQA